MRSDQERSQERDELFNKINKLQNDLDDAKKCLELIRREERIRHGQIFDLVKAWDGQNVDRLVDGIYQAAGQPAACAAELRYRLSALVRTSKPFAEMGKAVPETFEDQRHDTPTVVAAGIGCFDEHRWAWAGGSAPTLRLTPQICAWRNLAEAHAWAEHCLEKTGGCVNDNTEPA